MYNSPFNYLYGRPSVEDINTRIQELERVKSQMQQPTPTNLTQNFSLAPSNTELIRYVNGIDEVQKIFVIGDTPYFSKDLSTLWIKNAKGEIKTYELKEIIKKDEKDLMIEKLSKEIEDLRIEMKNNEYITNDNEVAKDVSTSTKSNAKPSKK